MLCDFAGINSRYRISHDVCEVLLRGSSHELVTKWHHFVNFQNLKNPRYAFCGEFIPECRL